MTYCSITIHCSDRQVTIRASLELRIVSPVCMRQSQLWIADIQHVELAIRPRRPEADVTAGLNYHIRSIISA